MKGVFLLRKFIQSLTVVVTSTVLIGLSSVPSFASQIPSKGQVNQSTIANSSSAIHNIHSSAVHTAIKRDATFHRTSSKYMVKAHASSVPIGQQIVDYAQNYLRAPYVWGGMSPSGFDCSGFTKYVYSHFGIDLPRTASGQTDLGTYVKESNLQPGDLVFFDTDGSGISHVGIYIGNGNFISAASVDVCISSLNSGYWAGCYVTARHIN